MPQALRLRSVQVIFDFRLAVLASVPYETKRTPIVISVRLWLDFRNSRT
ncbi:hypothetical protein [Nostoc sp.]